MQNIKLIIAYDGRDYLGWQKTFSGATVESILQRKLEQVLQHPICLQAASRTDKGVHARGQVVNFLTDKCPLDLDRLRFSINRLLPKDIIILSAEIAPISFHPTVDSVGKEYRYYLCFDAFQLPEHRFHSWHTPGKLDILLLRQAADRIVGTHNFAALCNFKAKSHHSDFTREIHLLTIDEIDHKRLCVTVQGNHFLYKMVRNIVGTLIYVGRGLIALEEMVSIFDSQDRRLAGITAPAHGLFLQKVFYRKADRD